MDESDGRDRLAQGYEDEGDLRPSMRERLGGAAGRGWAAPFVVGLLLGWIVLGWWIWPVQWTDAYPVDLTAADRAAYVQMVADAYARRADAAVAADRLKSFPAPTLAAALDAQIARAGDPVGAQNARQLKSGLATAGVLSSATPPPPAALEATAVADAGTAADAAGRWRSPIFWLGLLALAVVAALAVALLRRPSGGESVRDRSLARRRARRAARERATAEGGAPYPGDDAAAAPSTSAAVAASTASSAPPAAGEPSRPAPQRTGRLNLPALPADDTAALPMPRPPWQRSAEGEHGTGTIDIGGTASVLYDGSDEHFYQTWLVYDEREGLSGSINVQARKVGSLTSLDVWLYDRDVTGDALSLPRIAVLAQAAGQEAHLRALLRDRRILPAVPGAQAVLEVGELSLEVTVTDVSPPPEAGSLKLDLVRLSLTPFRYALPPGDDGEGDDGAAGRPPIQFRRDEG